MLPLEAVEAAYPEQLIKIIVTFPPGGSADTVIRALEPLVTAELKQSLVIENRAGAGGNIGMAAVAQAKPDGYTLGVAPAGALTVNPHLNSSMPFDPKDLAPITLLAEIPFVLVASASVPAHNATETIALAKAKPGALSIGHGGNSTAMHLTAALFTQKAGISMELVPYRGTAPAAVDVLAGHVPFAVLDIPASRQLILEGKLNAVGVSSVRRLDPGRERYCGLRIRGLVRARCSLGHACGHRRQAERRLREGAERSGGGREDPDPRRRARPDLTGAVRPLHSEREHEMGQAHQRGRHQGELGRVPIDPVRHVTGGFVRFAPITETTMIAAC
ncbi:Bug family tripartite tricarboxylate transporter substrate binding protein [Bradyrhizobium japonicum]|uniref:Bug family tripartite tricarboxylate transporter substrate binding protein n=1 Tax=Bradyrhizobium japonicum TaxID=375 RepID=UPI003F6733BC